MLSLYINPITFNKNEIVIGKDKVEWKKQVATVSKKKGFTHIDYLNQKYAEKIGGKNGSVLFAHFDYVKIDEKETSIYLMYSPNPNIRPTELNFDVHIPSSDLVEIVDESHDIELTDEKIIIQGEVYGFCLDNESYYFKNVNISEYIEYVQRNNEQDLENSTSKSDDDDDEDDDQELSYNKGARKSSVQLAESSRGATDLAKNPTHKSDDEDDYEDDEYDDEDLEDENEDDLEDEDLEDEDLDEDDLDEDYDDEINTSTKTIVNGNRDKETIDDEDEKEAQIDENIEDEEEDDDECLLGNEEEEDLIGDEEDIIGEDVCDVEIEVEKASSQKKNKNTKPTKNLKLNNNNIDLSIIFNILIEEDKINITSEENLHSTRKLNLQILKTLKLPLKTVQMIEKGIYNYAIDKCNFRMIIPLWENIEFVEIYVSKAKNMYTNLNDKSYIKNKSLIKKIKNGEINPYDLPFLETYKLFPEMWINIIDEKLKAENMIKESMKECATDLFECERCHQRKAVFILCQLRASDEPESKFITCLECGNKWKLD